MILLLLFTAITSAHATTLSQAIVNLQSQGFNCVARPSPDNCAVTVQVHECHGQVSGYPKPIRFYIPKTYSQPAAAYLHVHMHGHYDGTTSGNPFNTVEGHGDYACMLERSKANKIMVIPESFGTNGNTYDKNLTTKIQLKNFIAEVSKILTTTGLQTSTQVKTISFSGHSGAYRQLDALADYVEAEPSDTDFAKIHAVGYFDAVYGKYQTTAKWAWLTNLFFSNYLNNTSSPKTNNEKISQYLGVTISDWTVSLNLQKVDTTAIIRVPQSGQSFLYDHMSAMNRGGFPDFLAASTAFDF